MVSKILRNPVYMGKVFIPANDNHPTELISGIHEAIISETLFYQVQARLGWFDISGEAGNFRKKMSNHPDQ